MNKIKLILDNVSEIAGNNNIGLITLADEDKTRQVTIVCDHNMAEAIQIRTKPHHMAAFMLPEVVGTMFRSLGEANFEIVITDLIDEQYKAYIINRDTLDTFPIRASDAVLLSISARFPLYMDATLLRRQSVEYKEKRNGISIPINVISSTMLEESLKKAINDEDYETASKLHEELERRKKK